MVKQAVKGQRVIAFIEGLLIGVLLISTCGGGGDSRKETVIPRTEQQPGEQPPVNDELSEQNDANSGGDVPADMASPYRIEPGKKYTGMLDESDDGDAFMISYNSGDVACIKVVPSKGLDIGFRCAEFMVNDCVKGEEENLCVGSDISRTDITRIDIMVAGISGTGNYSIEVTMIPQNDGNSGRDAGEADEHIVLLKPGIYPDCHLGYGDNVDIYDVRVAPGQKATVIATPNADFDVRFWEWESDREFNSGVKGEEEKITSESERSEAGFYRFSVNTVGETRTPGTYTLKVSVE